MAVKSKMEMRIYNVYLTGVVKIKIEAIKYVIRDGYLNFYDKAHRKIASFSEWKSVIVDGVEIE